MSGHKLYSWHSKLMQGYYLGWIIVSAKSSDDARTKARKHFEKWVTDPKQGIRPEDIQETRELFEDRKSVV